MFSNINAADDVATSNGFISDGGSTRSDQVEAAADLSSTPDAWPHTFWKCRRADEAQAQIGSCQVGEIKATFAGLSLVPACRSKERSSHRCFPSAPKRTLAGRLALLERHVGTAFNRSDQEPDGVAEEFADQDASEWCLASASMTPLLHEPLTASPSEKPCEPACLSVSSVPAWARWPGVSGSGRINSDKEGEDMDRWSSTTGAVFEKISIEFKDPGEEPEEEASTYDGGDTGEDALDWDEFDCVHTKAAVVSGYRGDVGAGHNLPLGEAEDSEAEGLDVLVKGTDLDGEAEDYCAGIDSGGSAASSSTSPVWGASAVPSEKVTHILFVVHGMGATRAALERNVRDLAQSFREMQKYWFWHTDINIHVEMIDWKSELSDTQTSIFDRITPLEARDTRMSLNSTLSDVIFYKTAHYRLKIHQIVTDKMNARLRTLLSDPSNRFNSAGVSIVGHSLGSVIAYDVLTSPGNDNEGVKLEFQVDSFFLWGSPLAAFLSIADLEHQRGKFTLPRTLNMYNIFHPHDPVAFRLEPLYYHWQEQILPEMVPYWANNGIRPSKQWARSYEYAKGLAHQRWTSFKSSLWEAIGTSSEADVMRCQWDSYLNSEHDLKRFSASAEVCEQDTRANQAAQETQVRVDYVLQEHAVEAYVESYGLLQSHFCYWTSHDVALLMLKKISQQESAEINAVERDHREAVEKALGAKVKHDAQRSGDVPATEGPLAILQSFPMGSTLVQRWADVPCIGRRGLDQT